jgi:hypothetical protein
MSMPASPTFRIVGGDGKEYGPIDLATIQQWAREGHVAGQTQVWDSRTGQWQPATQIAELAAVLSAPPPPPVAASSAAPTGPTPGVELAGRILQRGYTVAFGDWISQGWQFFKANIGLAMGACWIVFGLEFGAGMVGLIPCFGAIVQLAFNLVIQPVLIGGIWYVLLQRRRGRPVGIGGVFDGFNLFFAQAVLVNLIMVLVILAVILPGGIVAGIGAFLADSRNALGVPLIVLGAFLILVPVLPRRLLYVRVAAGCGSADAVLGGDGNQPPCSGQTLVRYLRLRFGGGTARHARCVRLHHRPSLHPAHVLLHVRRCL